MAWHYKKDSASNIDGLKHALTVKRYGQEELRCSIKKKAQTEEYDVVVCGAGVAGFAAAVQSARLGARTALLERYGMPAGY